MFRIKLIALCGVLGLMSATPAVAQNPSYAQMPDVYFSAFIDRHSLGLIGTTVELHPVVTSAAVGCWLRDGIGVELEAGVGVADDNVGSLDVNFDSKLGIGLRLESPPVESIAAYAYFGYAKASYEVSGGSSFDLPGGRMAAGLTFVVTQRITVDAAFNYYDYDDEARTNSFRLGVRFNMGDSR